ncbi:MAG: preprotein translocase subunit YajC [Ruminiclostridium sp.]|nr:preprotein translocase subunit YajC [Ruminiclostridium sp.]
MDLITLLAATADDASVAQAGTWQQMLVTFIPLVLMLVVFYFLLIRPEKKRAAKMKEMLDNLQVADEVITTGGIIGRVLKVTEDTVLLETGSDRTRIRILRSSIAENRTVHENVETVTIKK